MRTVSAILRWPDGTTARGTLKARSPDLSAPARWEGDTARLVALSALAPRCDVDTFLANAEQHAAATGAEFVWSAVGNYELLAR